MTGVRFNRLLIDGHSRDVVAVDAVVTDQLVDIDVTDWRSVRSRAGDRSSCTRTPRTTSACSVGDPVTVEMAVGGPQQLPVAGTYADAAFAGNYLIDLEIFDALLPRQPPRPLRLRPRGSRG